MIRLRIQIVLSALLGLGLFSVACHRTGPVQRNADVGRVVKDTAGVTRVIKDTARVAIARDTGVIAFFKDTAPARIFVPEARDFKLQTPGQRQSLRAMVRKERELWRASKPPNYQFLLRVGCFCSGAQGWLLMEVRTGQPLRAWDRTGKSAALTDWNTFSIDGLYDNLERTANINGEVQIAFDPRWHFPTYVRTVVLPGPDAWSIVEARALRALAAERRR
ncbi:MAG TPA: DUF6174 domain-containing protein [Gemmatimonadaceae bacterium]|nr:DUF6174 domain-containing protein [Gemmatimonadaceae bacterium]